MANLNKTEQAYNLIKEKILTLDLKPGEPLKEVELSKMLDLSRTPIREAMQRLITEGFIESHDNQLNKVSDISVEKFIEIYQLREVLENLCVKLATFNWENKSEIEELRVICKHQMALARENELDSKEFLYFDRLFHKKLVEMSRNNLLIQELTKTADLYYRYNYFAIFTNRALLTVMEHLDIIEAIEHRDSRKAQQIMKSHLLIIRESIMIGLAKNANNFK